MSSVCFSVSLGLVLTANLLLKESSGLPIPTTPLPLPPGRFLPQPFDKDGYDYPGKKYPRNWGPPPPELYNPNTFKEQDPRSMIETNNVQQDFGNNYYNNYEPEGYYPEDDYFIEEEDINYDSMYSGENSYETSQMNYAVEPNNIYGNPYVNNGYPMYMANDFNNPESEYELELEVEAELESILDEDDDYPDDDINDMVPMMPPPTQPPPMPPSSGWSIQKPLLPPPPPPPLTQKPLPPPMQQQIQQMQQQAKQMAAASQVSVNSVINDYDSGESESKSKSRERISKPTRSTQSPLVKPIKEIKPSIEELHVEPREIELFSRTTTITKTTTWYINSDNEIVVSEEIDIKPSPLKGKYVKTSKTTTSGPVPWYLQGFEDVIFEEENGKSKTILDKMSYLKNMNPTSITSYTTAPNPWSTEVHEEVVFEETPEKEKKENQRNELDIKGHYSHSSPLEHIVDYLPRSQVVPEEVVDVIEKVLYDIKEEEIILEEMIEEEIVEMVPPYQVSTQPPKQYLYPQQSQEEMFAPDYRDYNSLSPDYRDFNSLSPDYRDFNSMNPNQITTPKSLPPPVIDNNFTPQPNYPRDPYQGPSTPAPTTPHPTQQAFTNHPQQPNSHPQQPNREHPGNSREIQQQRQNIDQPQEQVTRLQQQRSEVDRESQRKQIEAKRQLYQNRQQQQQQLQQQQPFPNRPNRPSRDL